MQATEPWALVGIKGAESQLNSAIYLCAETLRICGILLQPYMPGKTMQMLDMLGVSEDARKFENAVLGSDTTFGKPMIGLGTQYRGVLFPPPRSNS